MNSCRDPSLPAADGCHHWEPGFHIQPCTRRALMLPLVTSGLLRALAPVTRHLSSLSEKAEGNHACFLPGVSPLPSRCQRWSQGQCWIWLSEAGACGMFRDAASISPCPKDAEEKATPRACLQTQMMCFQHLETFLKISRGISAPHPEGSISPLAAWDVAASLDCLEGPQGSRAALGLQV